MTGRTADLPLGVRRAQEVERQRELGEGLMRRHVADSRYQRLYLAAQLARVLRAGPAVVGAIRGR